MMKLTQLNVKDVAQKASPIHGDKSVMDELGQNLFLILRTRGWLIVQVKGSLPWICRDIRINDDKPTSGWPEKAIYDSLTSWNNTWLGWINPARNVTISPFTKATSIVHFHISFHVFHILIILASNNASITDRTHRSHLHMHIYLSYLFISNQIRHRAHTHTHISLKPLSGTRYLHIPHAKWLLG